MNLNLGRIATVGAMGFVALLATATAPAHSAPITPTAGGFYYTFEQTIDPWISGSDKGPAGAAVLAMKGDSRCPLEGQGYAQVASSGDSTATGAAWMAADFHDNRALRVTAEWSAKDKGGCLLTGQPCQVEAYIGRTPPAKTSQFKMQSAVAGDWTSYQYAANVAPSATMGGDLYVAIGLLPPGGITGAALFDTLSTGTRMGVDCVKLTFAAPTSSGAQ
jgi:hypothetical protein